MINSFYLIFLDFSLIFIPIKFLAFARSGTVKIKLVSILLMLVFMIQILPLKEVASLLTSGQMTEDIHDMGAKKQNPNEEVHKKLFFYATLLPTDNNNLHQSGVQHVASDEALINNLLQEVLIQPPDLA